MTLDIARAFSEARERAAAAVRAGGNGIEVARALSTDVDAIVIAAAGPEVAKCKTPVAVFATGGFGRGELAPFSDLDLLVLCAKTPGADVQALAEAILYPLWDAKVDAGHAVRSYDQALKLPASDLAAATALLDARFLTGDEALGRKFLADFRARWPRRRPRTSWPGCAPSSGPATAGSGTRSSCSSRTSRTGRAGCAISASAAGPPPPASAPATRKSWCRRG